jgi:hypothetical protein
MAKLGTGLTLDQMKALPEHEQAKLFSEIKALRKSYKAVNYSAIYGVGKLKLSRTTGLSQYESMKLLEAYWKRNWAVQKVAENRKVRDINGELWIYNDVSGFWHSLRYQKDRWSTTNQSTGVYCFDTFVALAKANGVRVIGQFHDECVIATPDPEETTALLDRCCDLLNDKLKLNISLGIDYAIGDNYSQVH